MISQDVLSLLNKESLFFDSPIHGIKHWKTVERNAHYLASFNNADTEVLSYFETCKVVCVTFNGFPVFNTMNRAIKE